MRWVPACSGMTREEYDAMDDPILGRMRSTETDCTCKFEEGPEMIRSGPTSCYLMNSKLALYSLPSSSLTTSCLHPVQSLWSSRRRCSGP